MIKALLSLSLLLILVNAQNFEAICDFGIGVGLEGHIVITPGVDDMGSMFDWSAVTDPSGVLTETGNDAHIHQFGLNVGEGCGDTGSHFNPVANLGELTCFAGAFDAADVGNVMLDQDLANLGTADSIIGRSVVVHDDTGARVACCNIEIALGAVPNPAPSGYMMSASCGPMHFMQDAATTTITNAGDMDLAFVACPNRHFCMNNVTENDWVDNGVVVLANQTQEIGSAVLAIQGAGNSLAGTTLGLDINGTRSYCTVVLQTAPFNCGNEVDPCNVCIKDDVNSTVVEMGTSEGVDPTDNVDSSMVDMGTSEGVDSTGDSHTDPAETDTEFGFAIVAPIAMLCAALF